MYDAIEILKTYCSDNDIEIRNYSGRNFAKDCIGIIIPNGDRSLVNFVSEVWQSVCSENLDPETDLKIAIEFYSDFFSGIETDSMGRDYQIVYNREYKYAEYFSEIEDEEISEDFED